jgi:hypothetical protein
MLGKSLMIWNVRAMPRAARWCGARRVTSVPSRLIVPPVAASSPLMTLNRVV